MRAGLDRAQQAAEIEQMRHFLEIDDVGPGERQAQPWRIRARRGSTSSGSMRSGRQPSRPSITALSVPCPLPVAPSEPYSSTRTPRTAASAPVRARRAAKRLAAIIGPTVCELEGPMPILNRSKALTFIWRFLRPRVRTALDASTSKGASGR